MFVACGTMFAGWGKMFVGCGLEWSMFLQSADGHDGGVKGGGGGMETHASAKFIYY